MSASHPSNRVLDHLSRKRIEKTDLLAIRLDLSQKRPFKGSYFKHVSILLKHFSQQLIGIYFFSYEQTQNECPFSVVSPDFLVFLLKFTHQEAELQVTQRTGVKTRECVDVGSDN